MKNSKRTYMVKTVLPISLFVIVCIVWGSAINYVNAQKSNKPVFCKHQNEASKELLIRAQMNAYKNGYLDAMLSKMICNIDSSRNMTDLYAEDTFRFKNRLKAKLNE